MVFTIKKQGIQRWLMSLFAIILAFHLAACNDKETEQRKAFIDYLQNTVMRSGSKIPTLSENQKQKLGNYANDYNILVTFPQNFHALNDASLAPLFTTLSHIKTAQDYITQRDALHRISGTLTIVSQQIQHAQTQAENARAGLTYPKELKTVFDEAYNKVIAEPASLVVTMIPMVAALTQDLIATGDFLQGLGKEVYFSEQGVQLSTQAQVTQYNQLMSNIDAKSQALKQARERYDIMMRE